MYYYGGRFETLKMADDAKMASMKVIFEKTSDPAERTALTNAVINDGLIIDADETVTVISSGLFLSKRVIGNIIIEYEFKLDPTTELRVRHGKYNTSYVDSKNYQHNLYENGKLTVGESLVGTQISTTHYRLDGSVIKTTVEDFGEFPAAAELDLDTLAFKKFKDALKSDIEKYCLSGEKYRSLANMPTYNHYNEKIMTFIRNLCNIHEYVFDEKKHHLIWKQ